MLTEIPIIVKFPAHRVDVHLSVLRGFQIDSTIKELEAYIRVAYRDFVAKESTLLLSSRTRMLSSADTFREANIQVNDVICIIERRNGGMQRMSGRVQPVADYGGIYLENLMADLTSSYRGDELKKQLKSLEDIKLVLEKRLESHEGTINFDDRIDEDEVLLQFFSTLDENRSGTIEMEELQKSNLLKKRENAEMAKVLEDELGIDLNKLQTHFEPHSNDIFGPLRKPKKADSVRALFEEALSRGAPAAPAPPHHAAPPGFQRRPIATRACFEQLIPSLPVSLKGPLKELIESLPSKIDLLALKTAVRKVPRVSGQRSAWVRGIGLDAALARHLPAGTLDDELHGVKAAMTDREIERALAAFCKDAERMFRDAVQKLRDARGSTNAVQANSKFEGFFEGSFASLSDYHAGAEETMKLAYPNPRIEDGIFADLTRHPSAKRLFVTPNYHITTCLLLEYWWAKDPNTADKEVEEILKLLGRAPGERLFPGEVGDSFFTTLVKVEFKLDIKTASAAARVTYESVDSDLISELEQEKFGDGDILKTEVEKARGYEALNHVEFLEWENNSVLGTKVDFEREVENEQSKGNVVIGIILPIYKEEAKVRLHRLEKKIKDFGDLFFKKLDLNLLSVDASLIASKQTTYHKYTDLKALKKQHYGVHSLPAGSVESVRNSMAEDFVRSLRSLPSPKLAIALENMSKLWRLPRPLRRVEEAASLLIANDSDLDERWDQVVKWTALFRERLQGRTKLGLEQLKRQEKRRIDRFGLQDGEVLALHLYTGPCFVTFNCIYRNHPPHIVKLLEGNRGDRNTMSTTLFCISSALVKLGRHTELPEDRRVYRGLGTMLLPRQFWVEHDTPAWKGGVEKAIMSTTSDREVALFYSGGKGMVVEISVGRIQIGGDVTWCSMVQHKRGWGWGRGRGRGRGRESERGKGRDKYRDRETGRDKEEVPAKFCPPLDSPQNHASYVDGAELQRTTINKKSVLPITHLYHLITAPP